MLRILGASIALPALTGFTSESLYEEGRRLNARISDSLPNRIGPLGPFDAHQNQTVDTIAELIVPATDTPGARAARVNEFIAILVADWFDDSEREQFLAGLASVDERSRAAFGSVFIEGTPAQQTSILAALDSEAAEARKTPGAKPHFFHQMKWATLFGYYTSQVGVVQELKTQVWPGRYDPCAATGIPAGRGD